MKSKFPFPSTILVAAILALASCDNSTEPIEIKSNSVSEPLTPIDKEGFKVAFIYGDSVNVKYQFLIDAEAELEQERKLIDSKLNNKLKNAEKRAAELQKTAAIMTQSEMQSAQLELQGLEMEMQQMQERLGSDFRKRELELQQEYVDKVNVYLDELNADGSYDMILNFQQGGNLLWIKQAYDITDEVVIGLNERYSAAMATKKTGSKK